MEDIASQLNEIVEVALPFLDGVSVGDERFDEDFLTRTDNSDWARDVLDGAKHTDAAHDGFDRVRASLGACRLCAQFRNAPSQWRVGSG